MSAPFFLLVLLIWEYSSNSNNFESKVNRANQGQIQNQLSRIRRTRLFVDRQQKGALANSMHFKFIQIMIWANSLNAIISEIKALPC